MHDWDQHAMAQEAARLADEERIEERERRRVAREQGVAYIPPVTVIVKEPDPEPESVRIPEPDTEAFDEGQIGAIFDKLIAAALRR